MKPVLRSLLEWYSMPQARTESFARRTVMLRTPPWVGLVTIIDVISDYCPPFGEKNKPRPAQDQLVAFLSMFISRIDGWETVCPAGLSSLLDSLSAHKALTAFSWRLFWHGLPTREKAIFQDHIPLYPDAKHTRNQGTAPLLCWELSTRLSHVPRTQSPRTSADQLRAWVRTSSSWMTAQISPGRWPS